MYEKNKIHHPAHQHNAGHIFIRTTGYTRNGCTPVIGVIIRSGASTRRLLLIHGATWHGISKMYVSTRGMSRRYVSTRTGGELMVADCTTEHKGHCLLFIVMMCEGICTLRYRIGDCFFFKGVCIYLFTRSKARNSHLLVEVQIVYVSL